MDFSIDEIRLHFFFFFLGLPDIPKEISIQQGKVEKDAYI